MRVPTRLMSVEKREKPDQQKEIESKKIPFVLSGESQYHVRNTL